MTAPGAPARSAYRDALIAARRTTFRLDARAALRISEATRAFADDLARGVTAGPESEAARRAALIARRASLRLDVAIAQAIQEGRDLTARDVLGHWRRAMEEVAAARGVSDSLVGAIPVPGITQATIAEAVRPASTWRTLLRGHVLNAEQEAAALIREALTQGMAPDELARRLRRYVVGAEEFRRAFPDLDPADLRGVSREAQQAARRMRYNAERIAFSEIGNARREAELQHFAADPFVRAVRWTLSPDRGQVRTPDVCDVLAAGDFYGLGPGLYPVRRVPPVPHPWDRCEMVPVLFPSAEAGSPKPSPARIRSAFDVAVPGEDRLSLLARAGIHEQAEELLLASEHVLAVVR